MNNNNNNRGVCNIPNNVRKTIGNIKEITGNHSEDEIYAMLKECNMDPNEATQNLLSQDPFHEVKRKQNRKKEITIKESTEPRWKPGMQGRGNRAGRGNYSSRHTPNDAGSSRNVLSTKDKEINKGADDGVAPPVTLDKKNKEASEAASSPIVTEKISTVPAAHDINKSEVKIPTADLGDLSASDPILMPSQDSRLPIGTIRREVGSQRTPADQVKEAPVENKIRTASVPEVGSSFMQGKIRSEFQGDVNNLVSESSRPISRPPSNYNNRPQQAIGPQKGPVKEWKPKPTNPVPANEVPVIPVEDHSSLKPASSIPDSKESHIPDGQHVIIPNHLHVPEVEKLGFQFGSFDATFGINPIPKTASLSEASEEIVEHIEEQPTRDEDVLVTTDDRDYTDGPSSSSIVPENLSPESDMSSNVAPEHPEAKQEASLPTSGHQYPVAHPSSNLSFGFMPPIIGSHMASFETNESQARDASRVPSFVVQQPFDPAGYYPQFYRSGADTDGRISPFHTPKFNGNGPVLSQQASQSSQEVGNSLMLSTGGPTTLVTQAGGVSIGVTQQPMPVFRQPTGLHLPHYPPNYIPYAPYFSPFYLPPPTIHQFLSNGAFPQQPQGGSMYPAPPGANPKYPLPQYKPGSNTGNSGHIGVPGTYGPYGSNPTGYNPNPAASAGNSTSNDDLGGSQFKENNVYVTGQQSEGSGVWIAAPGRDMSGSYYNLPQGGQVAYSPTQSPHGAFASIYQPVTTGPIHPLLHQPQSMAGAVDMVGPTSTMYQPQQQPPPQPNQINWPNNY